MTPDEPFIHIPPFLDCRDPDQRDPLEQVEHVTVVSDCESDWIWLPFEERQKLQAQSSYMLRCIVDAASEPENAG